MPEKDAFEEELMRELMQTSALKSPQSSFTADLMSKLKAEAHPIKKLEISTPVFMKRMAWIMAVVFGLFGTYTLFFIEPNESSQVANFFAKFSETSSTLLSSINYSVWFVIVGASFFFFVALDRILKRILG